MKKFITIAACATCLHTSSWAAGGGGGSAPTVQGLILFDPPQARGCVAVRVEVPEDQMLTGVRWYNGTATVAFPAIFVASGSDLAPPPCSEAVVMVENVQGVEGGWSAAMFDTPVASESGTLFVVMEYPPDYTAPAAGASLGVGYAQGESQYPHFVSGDGQVWIRIASRCRVLLEPILADRIPGAVALRDQAFTETPEVAEGRLGLFASPNPFNPQTKIELSLVAATTGSLRVYDIRGRLVVELHRGAFAQGVNAFSWNGRDTSGRPVATGAYWVQARASDQSLTRKVLLLK